MKKLILSVIPFFLFLLAFLIFFFVGKTLKPTESSYKASQRSSEASMQPAEGIQTSVLSEADDSIPPPEILDRESKKASGEEPSENNVISACPDTSDSVSAENSRAQQAVSDESSYPPITENSGPEHSDTSEGSFFPDDRPRSL